MVGKNDIVVLKDINGKNCAISGREITEKIIEDVDFLLFEMRLDIIRELQHQYCLKGGSFAMTIDSIRKAFST